MSEKVEFAKTKKRKALNNWHPLKETLAIRFIEEEDIQQKRHMTKGSIHLCQLGENLGSEQNEERPVVIVSNDRINATSTNVKVVPLTKKLKTKEITNRKGEVQVVPRIRTHFFLKKEKYDFLDYDSAAKTEEVTTVSKIRMGKHLGNIDSGDFEKIKSRLKWVFDFK